MIRNRSGYALRRIVEPTQEPVTLDDVKIAIRAELDNTTDDARITSMIAAARELCESYTRRAFCEQTWRLTLDSFPPYGEADCFWSLANRDILELPRPPLISVSSVGYTDEGGSAATVASYRLDSESEPARIQPAYGSSWPGARAEIGSVSITYVAGYPPGSASPTDYAANVPESIKNAIRFAVNEWFWHCAADGSTTLPGVSQALLNPYRVLLL